MCSRIVVILLIPAATQQKALPDHKAFCIINNESEERPREGERIYYVCECWCAGFQYRIIIVLCALKVAALVVTGLNVAHNMFPTVLKRHQCSP